MNHADDDISPESKSGNLRRIGLTAFIILFIGGAALVAFRSGGLAQRPTVKLPNGQVLRLDAVTFGNSHRLLTGPAWRKKLQDRLPRQLAGLLGPKVNEMKMDTSVDLLVPWLTVDHPSSGRPLHWQNIAAVSDSGQAFRTSGHRIIDGFEDRFGVAPRFEAFPRRARSFTVTGMVDRIPFSIRIQNPLHGRSITEWAPLPLPTTNRVGDYTVVLKSATAKHHEQIVYGSGVEPVLEFWQDGSKLENQFHSYCSISDATGNLGDIAPTNEPAWKLNIRFWRNARATWHTNEYREIIFDDISADGTHERIDHAVKLADGFIHGVTMGGPGEFKYLAGVLDSELAAPSATHNSFQNKLTSASGSEVQLTRIYPWLMCELDPPSGDTRVSLFVRDADGKMLATPSAHASRMRGRNQRWYHLGPDWKLLDAYRRKNRGQPDPIIQELYRPPYTVRIAVQTNLTTEFIVDPADLKHIIRRADK